MTANETVSLAPVRAQDGVRSWTGVDPAWLIPWVCVAVVVAWQTAVAVRFPPRDGDLLWQRWLGERILHEHAIPRTLGHETFAAEGARWTPHEWLFSTLLAWSGDHGAAWLVPLICALAVGLALVTVVLRCLRRGVPPALASAAVLLCGLSTIQSFGARAQVLGWAALGTIVALLESEGPWAWAAVPVTVVWANLHASVFLSPAVAALFAFSALMRDRAWSPAVHRSVMLVAACGAATLATPFGIDLARYAVELSTSPIRQSISEWGATGMNSFAFAAGALPLVLMLAVYGVRTTVRDRVLAVVFTLLLFSAVRNVAVFAIVAAPIALAALSRRRAVDDPERERAGASGTPVAAVRTLAWATVLAVAFCGATITALTWRDAPAYGDALPHGTARALLAQAHATRGTPRVFCEDFAWCSLFLDRPVRFFMDGRCDPYPAPLWRDYREVIDGNARWAAILDRERIDAVLVRRNGALDSLLAERRAGWRRVASDRVSALYVRPARLDAQTPAEARS
jgi:hypothetical protein